MCAKTRASHQEMSASQLARPRRHHRQHRRPALDDAVASQGRFYGARARPRADSGKVQPRRATSTSAGGSSDCELCHLLATVAQRACACVGRQQQKHQDHVLSLLRPAALLRPVWRSQHTRKSRRSCLEMILWFSSPVARVGLRFVARPTQVSALSTAA